MTQRYIISLSSIPSRFHQIGPTLESLLAQTVKAEHVILYVSRSYRREPDWDGTLPEVPEGVEVRISEEDFGPATKLLPALKDFAGQDVEILFLDDDHVYPRHLAENMLRERRRRPLDSLAISPMEDYDPLPGTERRFEHQPRQLRRWRVTHLSFQLHALWIDLTNIFRAVKRPYPPRRAVLRAGYADGFQGYYGVMVRPEFFPQEVFDIPDFARPVDDVWLSGHATRMGHPPWILGGLFGRRLEPVWQDSHSDHTALHHNIFDGVGRDDSNRKVVEYFQKTYGIWL